jgi:hypothetical protein
VVIKLYSRATNGSNISYDKDIKFVKNGEFRAPKAGEYFLSGAIPEAYQSDNDLTNTKYHILRSVRVKRVSYYEIENSFLGRGDTIRIPCED